FQQRRFDQFVDLVRLIFLRIQCEPELHQTFRAGRQPFVFLEQLLGLVEFVALQVIADLAVDDRGDVFIERVYLLPGRVILVALLSAVVRVEQADVKQRAFGQPFERVFQNQLRLGGLVVSEVNIGQQGVILEVLRVLFDFGLEEGLGEILDDLDRRVWFTRVRLRLGGNFQPVDRLDSRVGDPQYEVASFYLGQTAFDQKTVPPFLQLGLDDVGVEIVVVLVEVFKQPLVIQKDLYRPGRSDSQLNLLFFRREDESVGVIDRVFLDVMLAKIEPIAGLGCARAIPPGGNASLRLIGLLVREFELRRKDLVEAGGRDVFEGADQSKVPDRVHVFVKLIGFQQVAV